MRAKCYNQLVINRKYNGFFQRSTMTKNAINDLNYCRFADFGKNEEIKIHVWEVYAELADVHMGMPIPQYLSAYHFLHNAYTNLCISNGAMFFVVDEKPDISKPKSQICFNIGVCCIGMVEQGIQDHQKFLYGREKLKECLTICPKSTETKTALEELNQMYVSKFKNTISETNWTY